jgi:hypothetical protein
MAKDVEKTNSDQKNSLPYSATVENIEKVIDTIKRRPGDQKNIKTICSFSDFIKTKNALEALNIVTGFDLTPLGRKIAYATGDKNKSYLDAIMAYPPYELLLMHIRTRAKGFETETSNEVIKNFWGNNSIGSSEDNRERAVPAFGSFVNLAGLGKLIVGRGKKPTRIEWSGDALRLIENYEQPTNDISVDQTSTPSRPSENIEGSEDTQDTIYNPMIRLNNSHAHFSPRISIEVNMSDWDDEKMRLFFKYAYGDFSDDRKEKN